MSDVTTRPFDDAQIAMLNTRVDPQDLKFRQGGGGSQLAYFKGYHFIDKANEIFGFGNWGIETLMVELVNLPAPDGTIIGSYYAARVKVTVKDCVPITEEGVCPVQEGRNPRATIDAHDMARKGAITDAMKRALRIYGDQFGNSLYDEQELLALKQEAQGRAPAGQGNRPVQGQNNQPAPQGSNRPVQNSRPVQAAPAPARQDVPAQPQAKSPTHASANGAPPAHFDPDVQEASYRRRLEALRKADPTNAKAQFNALVTEMAEKMPDAEGPVRTALRPLAEEIRGILWNRAGAKVEPVKAPPPADDLEQFFANEREEAASPKRDEKVPF